MFPAELGRSAGSAQIFFDNLTLEFGAELPLFSHGKILSARSGLEILPDSLPYLSKRRGSVHAWACAKVVTIILKKADVVNDVSLGVRHVEAALNKWQKIEKESDLKPGDIIVWVNSFTGREDKKCTGGGNCHVGIVTDKGYFHNSPVSKMPSFDGLSLWAF